MAMDCEQVRDNLLAYLDGEASDTERAEIEAHVSTCSECATALTQLQALRADLGDAVPAGMERLRLSSAAEARIRERLRQQQRRRPGPLAGLAGALRPRALARVAVPLLVVLCVVAAVVLGTEPLAVHAQETVVVAPTSFAPNTDAALRVIVREASSAQPIANAEVRVRLEPQGRSEVVLFRGNTGSDGTAEIRFRVPAYEQDDVPADLVVSTSSGAGRDEVRQQVAVRRSFRLYLTSDKPLYQPGQVIHQRVLALDTARGLPAAGRTVRFSVHGPHGERLAEQTVRASEYGIAADDYALSPSSPQGTYRLLAATGDTVSERTITVGHYERPRMHVELTTDRPYHLAGDPVRGQVVAEQFDGTPVPGLPVAVRAEVEPEQTVLDAQGRTDSDGRFAFSFVAPARERIGDGVMLRLGASVTGETGQVEWVGHVVPVAPEPLIIDVVAEGGRLRPGIPNTVHVLTARPDGMPVPAKLEIAIASSGYSLDTDEFGMAQFSFTPESGVREVQVQVIATDPDERTVAHTAVLSADRGPAQVLLRLDRATYAVGETMRIEVLAGQGDVAYVDVTRRDNGQALGTYLASLRGGRARLDVDVGPDMAGTVEVHAYQVLPDGPIVRDARVAVVDALSEISVTVQPAEGTFRPGQAAHLSIDTALEGTATQSALGIAVVDESVYELEDRTPGFAKLYFLLDQSLLELYSRPGGITLPEEEAPPTEGVRSAMDTAARVAWTALPASAQRVVRSVAQGQTPSRWTWLLDLVLAALLLCIPVALWAVVLGWLRRAALPGRSLRRAAAIAVGGSLVLVVPATAMVAMALPWLLSPTQLRVLLVGLAVTWLAALVALTVEGGRKRDVGVQVAALLVGAYGTLGTLLGYVAARGTDLGAALTWGIVLLLIPALAALLLLAVGLWLGKRQTASILLVALVLLTLVLAILAGLASRPSSRLGRAISNPYLYAGPVGWLSGCAAKTEPPSAAEGVQETIVVKETVVVEKEVEVEVTKVVEKEVEVTRIVEEEVIATASPPPTRAAPARPQPTPTAQPQPTATVVAPEAPAEGAPPPLLGQFVPETILWLPEAITDASGHLEVEVALPDAPATWRFTALASTRQGQLGSATALIHTKP